MQERARPPASAPPTPVEPLVEAGARALRGRGEPLAGLPSGHAHVHDDPLAHALAGAVGAHAFTVGDDIALSGTEASHAPGVLGHELAHVVQQGGTPQHGPLAPTQTADAVEQEVQR